MPVFANVLPWLRDHPWVIVGITVGLAASTILRAETWMGATDHRLEQVEVNQSLIGGIARYICLEAIQTKQYQITEAADIPCDSLLHQKR